MPFSQELGQVFQILSSLTAGLPEPRAGQGQVKDEPRCLPRYLTGHAQKGFKMIGEDHSNRQDSLGAGRKG